MMAFDLNKNDGAETVPSKFDLSKGEIEKPAGRSQAWLIGLFGILVVGGGIWYYATGNTDHGAKTSAPNVASGAVSVVVPAAPVKEKGSSMDKRTGAQAGSMTVEGESVGKTSMDAGPAKSQTKAPKALNHTVPVTFTQGSSSFAGINNTLIKRLITYLIRNPAASVHIDGYASSDGPIAFNQQISQARADAFKNHLSAFNIDASRITATGKGIENPVASNKTASGRKKNRRVEITLL